MAQWSYYLAYASSGILMLAFIFSLLRVPLTPIVWLALITSAVGTFMAWTARREFKARPGPADSVKMARMAWRVNLGALIVMLIAVVLVVILQLVVLMGQRTIEPETL